MTNDTDVIPVGDPLAGTTLLQEGEYESAKESYNHTLAENAENLEALFGLGIIHQFQNDYASARQYLERAVNLTGSPEILNNYGVASFCHGDTESAISSFKKAIASVPDFLEARRNLAHAYIETGDYAEGIEAYRELLAREPNDIETLLTLAGLYEEIDDAESSRYIYERVAQLDPQNELATQALAG